MQNTAFNYEIVEHIATLSQNGDTSKELNRVNYNGSPAKYDLRSWKRAIIQGETLEAPDFPPEVLAQAEEASRAFNAQAEDATKAMQEYIERGERRQ